MTAFLMSQWPGLTYIGLPKLDAPFSGFIGLVHKMFTFMSHH